MEGWVMCEAPGNTTGGQACAYVFERIACIMLTRFQGSLIFTAHAFAAVPRYPVKLSGKYTSVPLEPQ